MGKILFPLIIKIYIFREDFSKSISNENRYFKKTFKTNPINSSKKGDKIM